jgi:transposase
MDALPNISREHLMILSKERLIELVLFQAEQISLLRKRIDELESRLNTNSTNSNKPPSSDNPFSKPARKISSQNGKPGAKKGHKGIRQQLLEPTEIKPVHPERCSCGSNAFVEGEPYYTHQHIGNQSQGWV